MTVETKSRSDSIASADTNKGSLVGLQGPRLPYYTAVQERFGIDQAAWRALVEAVFPAAKTVEGVLLALSYCKARKLDPFKRPVHVVPIWDKARLGYVESVWPGIGELRTTAFRTGTYAGSDEAVFGPDTTQTFKGRVRAGAGKENYKDAAATVTYPAWCQFTVYRLLANGQRAAIPGPKVFWLETYARSGNSELPNDMWSKRPRGQLEKCAEAAALRRAFPEELGNEITAEEAAGQSVETLSGTTIDHEENLTPSRPTRDAAASFVAGDDDLEDGVINSDAPEAAADEPREILDQADQAWVRGWYEAFDACQSRSTFEELLSDLSVTYETPQGKLIPEAARRQVASFKIEAEQRLAKSAK